MGRPIQRITIVGGGTAGWLAAAMINHRLQWGFAHPEGVRVTLIESPDTPTIGVGEATLPGIKQSLELLEISEAEFITRTNATFKMAVRLEGWHDPKGPKPKVFHHPLSGGVQLAGRNPAASLLAYGVPKDLALDPEIGNVVGHAIAAVYTNLSPRHPQAAPYEGVLGYGYHFDAGLFAAFLQELAVSRGVEHVRDHVVGIEKDDRGLVAALQLKNGGRHEVELVVDCSGFRGLLINEAMGEPFISFADYLPNDRAIPIQIAHKPGERLVPATIATALGSGWRWRIPLQSRVGTGYVFCSAFADDAAATDELVASLGDAERVTEPRTMKMRIGRTRKSWVGNVVAIGLSGGFIEPLESTAIQFIDIACRRLLQCFPSTDFEQGCADKFNAEMEAFYDEVRDFLSLHFTLGDREDTPYWRAMRHEVKRSDRLEECLAIWRHSLPDIYDPRHEEIFNFWSVTDLLFGKGFYETPPRAGAELMPEPVWRAYLQEVKRVRTSLFGALPDVETMLRMMAQAVQSGETSARQPRVHTRPTFGNVLGPTVPVMNPDNVLNPPRLAAAPQQAPLFGMITRP
jgi:tryptophan 6-halogenase